MAYTIVYTLEARDDLRALTANQRRQIEEAVPRYLSHEPAAPSYKRRPLDLNPYGASWELRLGALRVLYALDETIQTVRVLRAGRKEGNRLYLRGVPVEMRVS